MKENENFKFNQLMEEWTSKTYFLKRFFQVLQKSNSHNIQVLKDFKNVFNSKVFNTYEVVYFLFFSFIYLSIFFF